MTAAFFLVVPGIITLLWGCLVLLLLCLIVLIVYLVWVARRAANPSPVSNPDPASPEADAANPTLAAELPSTFSGALDVLRSHVPGPDFRYTLPWFLLLGPAGAGKSSLISDSTLSNVVEEQIRLEQGAGFTWSFFSNGIVIEVGGWALSTAVDAVSAWRRLLRLFLNNRPARPLDGILLAIPVSDLTGPEALTHSALISRGTLIQQRLKQITQTLSFQLPIYVILTKCDSVPGFSQFTAELAPEEHQQIFGWSRPQNDSIAFHPAWVDQAIDSMRISLERKQGELFTLNEPDAGRGAMFFFPGALYSIAPNLRLLLDRAMRGNDHTPPPLLRGIYCCGSTDIQPPRTKAIPALVPVSVPIGIRRDDMTHAAPAGYSWAANQIESWLQSGLQIAFTSDLFLKKIFAEKGLATPLARHFAIRDRVRLALQISSAIVAVLLVVGTAFAYHRLKVDQQRLIPLLDIIEADLQTPANTEVDTSTSQRHAGAATLIHAMAGFETQGFSSVFIPASWFTNVNTSIRQAMVPAFRVLVLQRFHQGLEARMRQLSDPNRLPLPNLPATSPNHIAPPTEALDQIPEYLQMQAFIQQASQLQQFVASYNQMSRHMSGLPISSIIELDGYLQHRRSEVADNEISNPYFEQAVRDANWTPLDFTDETRRKLSAKGLTLSESLFDAWIEHNPTRTVTEQLASRVNTLSLPSRHTYEELSEARSAFSNAFRTYNEPSLQWTGADDFVMPASLAAVTINPLANTELFAPTLHDEALAFATESFARFASATDEVETSLTGSVVKAENGKLELSDHAQEMQVALENLLNLSFMSNFNSVGDSLSNPPRSFTWNKASLESAATLPAIYQRYLNEDLDEAPVSLRAAFSRIASEQLSRTLLLALNQSMQPAPPIRDDARFTDLSQQAQDFADVEGTITSLAAVLQQSNLHSPLTQLTQSSVNQTGELLLAFDRTLDAERPYGVSTDSFSRWTADGKPSVQIFDALTPDAMEAYLTAQRSTVEGLTSAAAPLVDYLRANRSSLSPRTTRELLRWQGLTSAVEQYKSKRPGNSLQLLEDFIATGADKFAASKSCDTGRLYTSHQTDYFALENAQLHRALALRCQALSNESFERSYSQLATRFNRDLAGRFPFAPLESSSLLEADPQLVAAVIGQHDVFDDQLAGAADASVEAHIFLSQLQAARPWFASLLSTATAGQLPSLDIVPAFRVDREQEIAGNQIIDWSLQIDADVIHASEPERKLHWNVGDPVRLSLRWAKDAPYLPAPAGNQPHSGYDLIVSGDTVTYTFKDPWSLLRMIQTFTPSMRKNDGPNSSEPFTLALSIPEIPASTSSAKLQPAPTTGALVFLHLLLFAPGEKQNIHDDFFPVSAPSLPTTSENNSSTPSGTALDRRPAGGSR
jgi:type VI secretion system protein ImpL